MKTISYFLIGLIKIYKIAISPFIGNNCRYFPSCSDYFIECIKTYGPIKGTINGTKRILTCHPFKFLGGGEGFDPVQKIKKNNNNGN